MDTSTHMLLKVQGPLVPNTGFPAAAETRKTCLQPVGALEVAMAEDSSVSTPRPMRKRETKSKTLQRAQRIKNRGR